MRRLDLLLVHPPPLIPRPRLRDLSLLPTGVLLHWATLVEPSKSVLVFPGQRVQKFWRKCGW